MVLLKEQLWLFRCKAAGVPNDKDMTNIVSSQMNLVILHVRIE
jgi:hypothetical protein